MVHSAGRKEQDDKRFSHDCHSVGGLGFGTLTRGCMGKRGQTLSVVLG